MLINTLNPETIDYEKSYLATGYSEGVTLIEVKNTDRFAANDRIMIGEMGQEKTEIVTVSAPAGDGVGLTIGATVFPHSADDPVTIMQFDTVKYYRSTTGSSGTFSFLTSVALDVDNDTLETVYDDVTGLATYYYKVSMYHSIDAIESALSDAIPGGGFSRNQVGYLIDEILQELADPQEQHITRREIMGYFNDVNDDLLTNVSRPYDFLRTRAAYTRTSGQNYLDFPTDSTGYQSMWKFDRLDYNYTDTTTDPDTDRTFTIKVIPEAEFRNKYQSNQIDSTTESDLVQEMCLDTAMNRFRYWPASLTTTANTFYLYYYKFFTRIESEGNVVETPTSRIYKLYIKMMYYRKRTISNSGLSATAANFEKDYVLEKARYKGLDRKDAGTPRSFRPADDTINGFRR